MARPSKLDWVAVFDIDSTFNKDNADVVDTSLDSVSTTLREFPPRLEKVEQQFDNSGQPPVRSSSSLRDSGVASNNPDPVSQGLSAQSPSSRPLASVSCADQASKLAASNVNLALPASKPSVFQASDSWSSPSGWLWHQNRRQFTCFVGRLNKSTAEEDLHDYLESVGIRDAMYKKLEPNNGCVFGTAALQVSCKAECRELFYEEDNWTQGS